MIDVKKVARLARLSMSPEEEKLYQEQLINIVDYFRKLEDVDTEGVEPFISPVQTKSHWRQDKVIESLDKEEALKAAPELMGKLFRVPPVV